jgi:hypothetical protein
MTINILEESEIIATISKLDCHIFSFEDVLSFLKTDQKQKISN